MYAICHQVLFNFVVKSLKALNLAQHTSCNSLLCMKNADTQWTNKFDIKMIVKSHAIDFFFKSWGLFRIYLHSTSFYILLAN